MVELHNSARRILDDLINDFQVDNFTRFFREKNRSFAPRTEALSQYDDAHFRNGVKLGEIKFADEKMLICAFEANQPLSERSGKKAQYEKGKKILKESQSDAGIFIFYSNSQFPLNKGGLRGLSEDRGLSSFRFSLIYPEYTGTKRQWSYFNRFTYFVRPELTNKTFLQQIGEGDFSSLQKIKEAFSVEPVTRQFYNELQSWHFWAMDMDNVQFPKNEKEDKNIHKAKNLIRLITRIIFIWFMKEKKLVPPTLFDKSFLDKILLYNDKTCSTYYKAILQNLFFATLNTSMKKDDSKSRMFVDEAKRKGFVSDAYMQHGYYRYKRFLKDADLFLQQFETIPFLNGGLFDCLDKRIGGKEIRIDCFSDNPKNEVRLKIPDEIFFREEEIEVNLEKYLGSGVKRKVRGLLSILKSYNFTIDENTPIDEEIALDPELLGHVFENLLASYNPETATTARKATGSYYTPREIVDYMVQESLIAYLKEKIGTDNHLPTLFDYASENNPFDEKTTEQLIDAIEGLKILDPACGSGAFPMGMLHKLVLALHKLDHDNSRWKKRLLEKVPLEIREETRISLENKPLDYIRKLGLIEHCIYGVDIQEIAIQISKLRFFISLLVEQQMDDTKPNRDIKALPNLDTKFVAANTLIGLDKLPKELFDSEITKISKELFKIREEIFYVNSRWKKIELEKNERKLRNELAQSIQQNIQKINKEKIQSLKLKLKESDKELHQFFNQPEEIETIEVTNLFGEKKITKINKAKEKITVMKREISRIEKQIRDLE